MIDSRSQFSLTVIRHKENTRFLLSLADLFRADFSADFDQSIYMLGAVAPGKISELFQNGQIEEKMLDHIDTYSDKKAVTFVRDLSGNALLCPSCGASFRAVVGATVAARKDSFAYSVAGVTVEFSLPKSELVLLGSLLAELQSPNAKAIELHPQLVSFESTPQESEKSAEFALSGKKPAA